MLVHRRVTHLYTWVERGSARVKCLAQEHNTMSQARAETRTARSGDERTNHEATAHPITTGQTDTIIKVSFRCTGRNNIKALDYFLFLGSISAALSSGLQVQAPSPDQ